MGVGHGQRLNFKSQNDQRKLILIPVHESVRAARMKAISLISGWRVMQNLEDPWCTGDGRRSCIQFGVGARFDVCVTVCYMVAAAVA